MDFPSIDNTDAYIKVCEQAGLPINKLPKKGDKIELSYEVALKQFNPKLYQNITSPDPDNLPADVAKRYKQGLMWVDYLKAYEDCGFTGTADNIRRAITEAQNQKLINETNAMKERNDKHAEMMRNRVPGIKHMPDLPMEQVLQARQQFGYTGLADWQKN